MAKKKVPLKAARSQKPGAAPPKLNPFELKGSKRKFDVLGRREKAGKKNVVQSREAAVVKVRPKRHMPPTRRLPSAAAALCASMGIARVCWPAPAR